jgi:hypothetical protein
MTSDQAETDAERGDPILDHRRHLAAEIIALLPKRREEAYGVLSLVVAMLRLPVPAHSSEPEPPPSVRPDA